MDKNERDRWLDMVHEQAANANRMKLRLIQAEAEIDRLRAKVWEATRVVGSLQCELIRARFDARTRPEADPSTDTDDV